MIIQLSKLDLEIPRRDPSYFEFISSLSPPSSFKSEACPWMALTVPSIENVQHFQILLENNKLATVRLTVPARITDRHFASSTVTVRLTYTPKPLLIILYSGRYDNAGEAMTDPSSSHSKTVIPDF